MQTIDGVRDGCSRLPDWFYRKFGISHCDAQSARKMNRQFRRAYGKVLLDLFKRGDRHDHTRFLEKTQ